MVSDSAMCVALVQFVLQVREQLGVARGVDLAAQDALGAGDRELRDLVAQLLPGALRRERGLFLGGLLRCRDDPRRLGARFVDERRALALGAGAKLGRARARLLQLVGDPALGRGEVGLGLVGRGESVGDALGTLVERLGDRRPDELRREPPQAPGRR